jgi:tRNA dimethylallyltransferase
MNNPTQNISKYQKNSLGLIDIQIENGKSLKKLPLLLTIVGPTAVGKTETAILLAEQLNGEIISADSRLFYRGMDIGTAKPSLEERSRIPHHLIDVSNPDETWSLAVFQKAAREIIEDIHAKGKLPFLVGGTGQYIRAVTEGWTPPVVQADPRLRLAMENLLAKHNPYWLHARLKSLDPVAAEKIDARNVRRTIRALEVILSTGRLFSDQRSQVNAPYNPITIGLIRPREELYSRVDARIEAMFDGGLIEEVRKLLEAGYSPDLPSMTAIGYRECVAILSGKMSLNEAKIEMRRATRVFVRRQANWFKENDLRITWFPINKTPTNEIVEWINQSVLGKIS